MIDPRRLAEVLVSLVLPGSRFDLATRGRSAACVINVVEAAHLINHNLDDFPDAYGH